MPTALFWDPLLNLDFSKSCFRAMQMPAALFWGPFLDLDFSKSCFQAMQVPAAFSWAHFGTLILMCCFPAVQVPPAANCNGLDIDCSRTDFKLGMCLLRQKMPHVLASIV